MLMPFSGIATARQLAGMLQPARAGPDCANQTIYIERASQNQGDEGRPLLTLETNRRRKANMTRFRKAARAGRLMLYFSSILAGASCTAVAHGAQSVANTGTASADQFLSSYEGQTVSAVQIAGCPEDIAAKYSRELVQKAGEPFSKEKVNQSAAALKAAGNFEQVQVIAEPNGVRVVFVVEPAIYFSIFQFSGAKQLSYAQLIQATNYPIQAAFNSAEVNTNRDSLLTFLRQQGLFRAEVQSQVSIDSAHALANVDFQTALWKTARSLGRPWLKVRPTAMTRSWSTRRLRFGKDTRSCDSSRENVPSRHVDEGDELLAGIAGERRVSRRAGKVIRRGVPGGDEQSGYPFSS